MLAASRQGEIGWDALTPSLKAEFEGCNGQAGVAWDEQWGQDILRPACGLAAGWVHEGDYLLPSDWLSVSGVLLGTQGIEPLPFTSEQMGGSAVIPP